MNGKKKLPTLAELRRRYEKLINDVISSPPPQSAPEAELQRIDWYCDLHEVLFKWVDEGERPT